MLITVELSESAETVLQKFRTSTSKTLVVVAPTCRLSRGRKAGKIPKDRKDGVENEKNSDEMVTPCTPWIVLCALWKLACCIESRLRNNDHKHGHYIKFTQPSLGIADLCRACGMAMAVSVKKGLVSRQNGLCAQVWLVTYSVCIYF
jgi:hypothetical protein